VGSRARGEGREIWARRREVGHTRKDSRVIRRVLDVVGSDANVQLESSRNIAGVPCHALVSKKGKSKKKKKFRFSPLKVPGTS
jgi:hypothetical protein